MTPLGIKMWWGGGSWKIRWGWTGETEQQKSAAFPATSLPFVASPIPASPCLRGLNNCSWWGGKCSLCSFSAPLGVLPTLTTLAISCCLTLSEFYKHGDTNAHANTQALRNIWTLLTLLPLIFLCGALCSCCSSARWEEQGEQSEAKKK